MFDRWLQKHTASLAGKTVAVTGSTGGLGKPLCHYLASLGADLVLVDRSRQRSQAHQAALQRDFPNCRITLVQADLADMASVKNATAKMTDWIAPLINPVRISTPVSVRFSCQRKIAILESRSKSTVTPSIESPERNPRRDAA